MENYVYFRRALDQHIQIFFLLYVDEILITSTDKDKVKDIKEKLSLEFEMKYLWNSNKILAIKIKRDRRQRILQLSWGDYFQKLLDKFGMPNYKLVKVPLAFNFKLSSHDGP